MDSFLSGDSVRRERRILGRSPSCDILRERLEFADGGSARIDDGSSGGVHADCGFPPVSSGIEDVSVKVADAVPPFEPVACAVKNEVPAEFGVPERTPADESESPNGTAEVAA